MVAAVCRFGRTAFLLITITFCLSVLQPFANARCDYTFNDGNKLYNYTLSSPIRHFPHGILSEDGFYKVSVNESTLWFQLCDEMVFNHDPPICADCWECGGPARCGMECNALVSNNIGGYHVCTTLGRGSQIEVDVIDKKNPHTGVIVKMSSGGLKTNCSLAVSVLCDYNGVKEPYTLQRLGACNYATQLKHPSACAIVVNVHGGGLGWFGTLSIVVVCLFATYLLAGAAYRFFFLGIRGVDAIPNVDFWASLPRRIQIWFSSLVRRFKGPSEGYRSSYSPVNF
ncbi:hypothetical protein HN51_058612 [Arachis hypogaea]|uniref:uncharacterized protein LOC107623898 isoform X1 n=1 Tax=Arachis ipaensis TaxID=130454 RepID=UPI0007AEEFB3|nr:uncharacterized protein LOC107623898 isoform X1 [Arachis ipaensis]XP_025681476.1 uncharacterized protein LOC112782983 isoform X1 [Arachis hypogaea]QHN81921.1 uncharacterized protein DS421_20g691150 [Arachis hypogaea]